MTDIRSWLGVLVPLVFIGLAVWSAFRHEPYAVPFDPAGAVSPEKVDRAKKVIRFGRYLTILALTSLVWGLWRMLHTMKWSALLPFFVATATSIGLILAGRAQIVTYSKGTAATADPRTTNLLREIAELDRGTSIFSSSQPRIRALLGELVEVYSRSDETHCAAIRNFFRNRLISLDLPLITAEAARQLGERPDKASAEASLLRGLMAAAIYYEYGDFRGVSGPLTMLVRNAREAGLDPIEVFRGITSRSYPDYDRFVSRCIVQTYK